MEFTSEVVHDSMGVTGEPIKELRGVKIGDKAPWDEDKIVTHITPAGEAIFQDGSWDYVDAINGTKPDL